MSMHRIPLTSTEEAGLKAHGLDIGTPSQLSDVFRQGIAWGSKARLPIEASLLEELRVALLCAETGLVPEACTIARFKAAIEQASMV